MARIQDTILPLISLLLLGCSDSLIPSEETLTPDAPTLLYPEDGGSLDSRRPPLGWEAVNGATRYHLQLDDDADFSSPRIDESVVSGNGYQIDGMLPIGVEYHWRIAAANRYGESKYSSPGSFTCSPDPRPIPQPLSPANGTETTDSTPTFCWTAVDGADWYALRIDDDSEFGSPDVYRDEIEETEFTLESPLQRNRTYYWQVCTKASGVWSEWSEPWSFDLLTAPDGFYYSFDGTMDWTWDEPQIYEIPDEGRAYFNCRASTGYSKAYTGFNHTLAVGDIFEAEIDARSWSDTNTRQGVYIGFFSNLPSEWIGELDDGVFIYFSNYWTAPKVSFLFYENGISSSNFSPLLLELALYRFRVGIITPHQFSLTIWRDGVFFSQEIIDLEDIDLTEIEVNYAAIFNARIYYEHGLQGCYEGYVNELSLGQ